MPLEDLTQRVNVPTLPVDPNDPGRFSQLTEIVKDAFQQELTTFLNLKSQYFQSRKMEIPTIQKYELGFQPGDTAVETFTRVLLQHPDILEKLPLIAITSASAQHLALGIGTQIVGSTQMPARVKGTVPNGPYALVDGDKIAFSTTPNGKTPVTSTVLFKSQFFQSIGAAQISEIIALANVQLLYVTAKSTSYSTPGAPVLRFDAMGVLAKLYPNSITVLGPPYSTTNALNVLGFTPGQTSNSKSLGPANRYQIAANMTIGIDLGTESENERRELTDLINYFFVLEMDKRRKTFLGRSIFDDEFVQIAPPPGLPPSAGLQENYQITLLDRHSWSGEAELPRQAGSGEQQDLIYINRLNVPVTAIDYVDRFLQAALGNQPPYLDQATITQSVNGNPLPIGDHTGFGETSNT
jgi:hypothetical protein